MTEKKDLGYGPVEEEPLTAQQQQELHEQEQYFRQAFCSVSCPPLPESLSADAMWEKICSGAGDHQVMVDPASLGEQAPRQEQQASVQKGKVIPFPQRTGKKERARRRRTLAVACTLVLVVGLSVAYWQLRGPLGQVQGIVSGNSQASTAESAESSAAEATAADADTQTEESAEAVEEASKDGPYLSLDDFRQRTKVSKTVIDLMADLGLFGSLPQSNQISLFDLV